MQINSSQVFVGDLRKVTKLEYTSNFSDSMGTSIGSVTEESVLLKKDVVLIEVQEDFYVELERIRTFIDVLKIKSAFKKDGFIQLGGIVLSKNAGYVGEIFVDRKTIRPYFENNVDENISHKTLRKTVYK